LQYNIHCGDSELPYDAKELENFTTVAGNCDLFSYFKDEEIVEINGLRILITHGHLYAVKANLLKLSYRAQEVGAHIVCFGHSHYVHAETIDGTLFVNPGSIRFPRGRKEKTYAIMKIDEQQIKVKYYNAENGREINGLVYEKALMN